MVEGRSFTLRLRVTALGVALGIVGLMVLSLAANARASGEFEHNDTLETAYGPLEGGKSYTATFETDNDVDWYIFYIKTYSQMEFSGSMLVGSHCSGGIRYVELLDGDGHEVDTLYIGAPNETGRLNLTLDAGRYYLKFRNDWHECTGDRYSFRIDPAASITANRECGEAIVARDAVGPALVSVNEKLAENGEKLAEKTRSVRRAKKALRRLKMNRRASRWERQAARQRLLRAKRARDKVLQARANLQSLAAQQQQALSAAEGQIATSC